MALVDCWGGGGDWAGGSGADFDRNCQRFLRISSRSAGCEGLEKENGGLVCCGEVGVCRRLALTSLKCDCSGDGD